MFAFDRIFSKFEFIPAFLKAYKFVSDRHFMSSVCLSKPRKIQCLQCRRIPSNSGYMIDK